MSERTDISFDAALMMALRADAQRELDSLPTPKQFEEIYPDTSQWDERMTEALKKKKHHPVLKRVLIAALTLVMLTVGALAVSADFRRAVYTMIQKFLPIEMQLTYQVDGEPLEWLPDGYSTRTGVKKISVSGVLYEKGTIGTWQKVSSCSNSSTTSTCMVSSSFNTKPGKSYRLEYSATFSYSDGRSETITGSTSR